MKQKKEHIGLKIKRLRSLLDMTQHDLAEKVGKTRTLISHLETTGIGNKYLLADIAEVLNADPETFDPLPHDGNSLDRAATLQISTQKVPVELLIDQHKKEVEFLKDTIANQWKLLHELSKSK